jgi:peptidoglycan/LPS O-acetylase OafA/YrhL
VIQRIQSIYLFLAFVLNGTVFFNALYSHAMNDPQPWMGIGFTAVLIIAGLFSLLCIFLFKNRSNQVKWTGAAIALQTIAFGYGIGILISLGGFGPFLWDEAIGALILFIALIATYMARKKIKADQELVRSMDRIR